ncbi:hypothetical protein BM536_002905 [Streptomyces phaeoluteigriseus]|uniref:Uncharacterized protein n=1 Tax=Streptomyces phaeoluteigriseus TaxID=114686 RepID=A0A1V6MYM0_9ACTN|nr:hypothetical protein BM536_002905 [Streptomyces phaeoluteigriseus]
MAASSAWLVSGGPGGVPDDEITLGPRPSPFAATVVGTEVVAFEPAMGTAPSQGRSMLAVGPASDVTEPAPLRTSAGFRWPVLDLSGPPS